MCNASGGGAGIEQVERGDLMSTSIYYLRKPTCLSSVLSAYGEDS